MAYIVSNPNGRGTPSKTTSTATAITPASSGNVVAPSDYQQLFNQNAQQLSASDLQPGMDAAATAAYQAKQTENARAQNQFYQNQSANQANALDAIRRQNAAAIAAGANTGLSAAQELSSILGLQQETSQAATDIANADLEASATYQQQLADNAVKAAEQANAYNAQISANNAELAKADAQVKAAQYQASKEQTAVIKKDSEGNPIRDENGNIQYETDANGNVVYEQNQNDSIEEKKRQDEKNEANRQATIKSLDSITDGWATGDGQTFATEYYDPFQGKVVTGGNQNNQSGGEAGDMKRMATRIKAKITEAYNSGDQAEIDKWNAEASKFVTSIKTENDACLTPGTKITLANGQTKNVEDIDPGEMLLVWDLDNGGYDAAPVLFTENDSGVEHEIITLKFSDGTNLEFIYEHGFFNITQGKYVYLHGLTEACKYVGDWFFKATKTGYEVVELIGVTAEKRVTTTHSPCTVRHLCLFANGILTMPGNTAAFTNAFKVDKQQLCYDAEDKHQKIETYGQFTPEDFEGILPPEIFYAFQGEYLKVKIATGETSMEEINRLIARYAQFLK